MSTYDQLVLMFPNKKRKKLRFWVPATLTRRQQEEEFHVLTQELKFYRVCFCAYFRMSVGLLKLLLADLAFIVVNVNGFIKNR